MNNFPLVSIIIITYNSSGYVLETLESALAQTYSNIEIIISDDCSNDSTLDVCEKFLSRCENRLREKVTILSSAYNTGISGNCNRGLNAAKGKWIKIIAGDDILSASAISDYVEYVEKRPGVKHLIAKSEWFRGPFDFSKTFKPKPQSMYPFLESTSQKKQFSIITKVFFGSGPTYFASSEALRNVGGFDERFPMQEDYPLFIKMIASGYKMHCLDKVTAYHRVHDMSISHEKEECAIFSRNQVRMIMDYEYEYRKEHLTGLWLFFHNYSLNLQKLIVKNGNSKKSIICIFLKIIYTLTDPFVWYARMLSIK